MVLFVFFAVIVHFTEQFNICLPMF